MSPLLLVGGPLLPALLALALRRWPRLAALLAAAGLVGLWRLLAGMPAGELSFLGRMLVLSPAVQAAFSLVYPALALLMLLAACWPAGPDFVPASVAALSPLAGAVMVRPLAFGPPLWLAGAALLAVAAAGSWRGDEGGWVNPAPAALRFLLLVALAMPLFLAGAFMLESGQPALQRLVWWLLLAGLALLLAGFPFHIWVRPLAETTQPLALPLLFGLWPLLPAFFALAVLAAHPWLLAVEPLWRLLRWSGLATLLLGGLLAWGSERPRQVLGGLLLLDMGAGVLALSAGPPGFPWLLLGMGSRFVALLIAGTGLAWQGAEPGDGLAPGRWWAGLLLFLLGGLSLLGLPLTVGFGPRWGLVRLLAGGPDGGATVALVLFALAAGALGMVKSTRVAPEVPVLLPSLWKDTKGNDRLRARAFLSWLLFAWGAALALVPAWTIGQMSLLLRLMGKWYG